MNTINYSDIINSNNNDMDDIIETKMHADDEKYFSLFDKYIPTNLKSDSKILLFTISNNAVISRIIAKNPNCKYYIFDISCIFKAINKKYNNGNMYNITIEDIFNSDMKFDCIIMNPPYNKNLHLKILEQAIAHLKDDNSVCVNLSPVRWLQDPFSHIKKYKCDYNKFKESISKHINSLIIIPNEKINKIFDIEIYVNIGIYICKKSITNFDFKNLWTLNYKKWEILLFNKISNDIIHLSDVIELNKRDGIRVLIAKIAGNRGALPIYKDLSYVIDGYKNNKDWTLCKNNGGYKKEIGISIPNSIKFKNEFMAKNFYNSINTKFYKFICNRFLQDQNIPLYWLPWMGNSINPRTGLKGYESEWIDEDFYKFFNITEEEQKHIENIIGKYK